jgi:hypothetical protein
MLKVITRRVMLSEPAAAGTGGRAAEVMTAVASTHRVNGVTRRVIVASCELSGRQSDPSVRSLLGASTMSEEDRTGDLP